MIKASVKIVNIWREELRMVVEQTSVTVINIWRGELRRLDDQSFRSHGALCIELQIN